MSFYGWKPYVPVAARRAKAAKLAAKSAKKGAALSPAGGTSGAIAKTFWGRAWCANLEAYSDFSNRLPRGRTYLRNGSVIDLKINSGEVLAQVVGSSLYKVSVSVAAVPGERWQAIGAECAASIDSLVELLQGRLSKSVMERICKPGTGLFPAPREIKLACSCPDWADMCKHVAAVLYGVGARLDQQPELLFLLRKVDPKELVARAGAGLPRAGKGPAASKVLDHASVADVFGIEMDESAAVNTEEAKRVAKKVAPSSRKAGKTKAGIAVKAAPKAGKPGAARSVSTAKKAS